MTSAIVKPSEEMFDSWSLFIQDLIKSFMI